MSSPKFLVFKLKDLRIPVLILLIAAALFVFFLFKNKTAQTFAPSHDYQSGRYIAGVTLPDTELDVVVNVDNNNITSISLEGLDDTSSALYEDLTDSIDYINTYVTATQSLELPANKNTSTCTLILMDAVKVALSDQAGTSVTNTYEKINLPASDNTSASMDDGNAEAAQSDDDIFVDEFADDDTSSN